MLSDHRVKTEVTEDGAAGLQPGGRGGAAGRDDGDPVAGAQPPVPAGMSRSRSSAGHADGGRVGGPFDRLRAGAPASQPDPSSHRDG
ncbi:hypothetical protein GCM10009546_45610 [Actinomadura livida]|uniref:Uncharacterized protein n=1 Tax=Actinomadura livida TaxID=79909 RepID=A0ABN1EZ16_9ACTN|nr:hypothetical protein GCM10010208_12440 [Actinomadura livida]